MVVLIVLLPVLIALGLSTLLNHGIQGVEGGIYYPYVGLVVGVQLRITFMVFNSQGAIIIILL